MCKVLDDALPIVGAALGSVVPGLGTGLGAALGGALGGGISGYSQNHNLPGTLTGGLEGGAGGYAGIGGGFGNLFNAAGSAANSIAPDAFQAGVDTGDIGAGAFDTGLGAAGADTTGALETGLGGSALFGPAAGTGTALGAASQGLGAGGLGIAGAGSLGSEFAGSGGTYAAGLGGGTPTGLGVGGATVPQGPVATGAGGQSLEGGQTFTPAGGNPGAAGALGPGAQTGPMGFESAATGGGDQGGGNLSTMFGPSSTAAGSPMGSGILGSTEGSSAGISPFGANLGQPATSGGAFDYLKSPQGLQDIMKFANSGVNAWQQYQKGQAAKNYAGQISSIFGPNSPYAQQMQQTLARTDAAAGRNSQYGTRAVQLAAALAKAQAQALGGNNYAQAAQNTSGGNILNGLFSNFASPQGAQTLSRLGTAGFNGLSQLFGS